MLLEALSTYTATYLSGREGKHSFAYPPLHTDLDRTFAQIMNILLTEENDDLPTFCWMSKLPKNGYRERINSGNYVCEINELNRTMTAWYFLIFISSHCDKIQRHL
jgi:hypothetical protein